MDKKSRLKEELRLLETGRDFLENVELPKHTNPLPSKVNDKVKPYKKVNAIPLEKLKEILDGYDGSIPSMITQFSKIQKLVESEE